MALRITTPLPPPEPTPETTAPVQSIAPSLWRDGMVLPTPGHPLEPWQETLKALLEFESRREKETLMLHKRNDPLGRSFKVHGFNEDTHELFVTAMMTDSFYSVKIGRRELEQYIPVWR